MENQEKIIVVFFIFFFLLSACSHEKKTSKNTTPITKQTETNGLYWIDSILTLKTRNLHSNVSKESDYFKVENDTICFFKILTKNLDTVPLQSVIDQKSFNLIGIDKKDRLRIRNPYYLDRGKNYYYKDKTLFYVYLDQDEPDFFILDSVQNVELLGGAYIRTNSKVYYRGFEVKDASSKTFSTLDIFQPKSEWKLTIGLDSNNIYLGKETMDRFEFDRLLWYNDSLKDIYFPE